MNDVDTIIREANERRAANAGGNPLTNLLGSLGRASEEYARLGKTPDEMEAWKGKVAELRNLLFASPSQPEMEPRQQRVYIALPRYGNVEWNTARQILCATGKNYDCKVTSKGSSLLACTFNMLLVECLNGRSNWDWFVMVHSDLWPKTEQDNWTDVMLGDAERVGAAVIHVPSPIKSMQGTSSTAIGSLSDDPLGRASEWWGRRRITIKELAKLPDVFNIDHVLSTLEGKMPERPCLLPNTGCLAIRIDVLEAFGRDGGFEVRDRVLPPGTISEQQIEWTHQLIPEDWNFGFWCGHNDVKVWGTRNVKIGHVGSFVYPNDGAWGLLERDDAYLEGKE